MQWQALWLPAQPQRVHRRQSGRAKHAWLPALGQVLHAGHGMACRFAAASRNRSMHQHFILGWIPKSTHIEAGTYSRVMLTRGVKELPCAPAALCKGSFLPTNITGHHHK